MFATRLSCTECPATLTLEGLRGLCEACGAPLRVEYDLEAARRAVGRDELAQRPRGLWRFREVLPLPRGLAPISLGEGDTPLLPAPRLASRLGLERLFLKDESLNPTASFKARGMSVAVSMAKALGATALAAPSAGNAGGALAAYGARAGLPVVIAMPASTPRANRLEAAACGARVELREGTIADCGRWIREESRRHGWFDLSTLKEPYRVEGKKTMGYELAEALGWTLPEVILYPTGGGTGLVGMAKAFDELRALGWIPEEAPRPRLVAVQAAGCPPVADAFHEGLERARAPAAPRTVASGLLVPTPIGDRWMLRVLRRSEGTAVTVTDQEIRAGALELARAEGVFAAPEAGALVAALPKLLASGWLARGGEVVLFITGSGLKYAEAYEGITR
jgi:threonine synthase